MREQLLAIRGIGPWTVNYALLRGYGWLGGSLHGDAAVRRGLQTLWGRPDKVSMQEAEDWLAPFAPCARLWGPSSGRRNRQRPTEGAVKEDGSNRGAPPAWAGVRSPS